MAGGLVLNEDKGEAGSEENNRDGLYAHERSGQREEVMAHGNDENGEEIDWTMILKWMSIMGFCLSTLGWVLFLSPRQIGGDLDLVRDIVGASYAPQVSGKLPRQDVSLQSPSSSALPSPAPSTDAVSTSSSTSSSSSTASATPTRVLQVFQLDPPIMGVGGVLLDDGVANSSTGFGSIDGANGTLCQVTLMEHEFTDSFGQPFVGNFTPPACIGTSNTVIMNFTVQSKGTQFDRLATMYFGDTEIFRTSTAEPKRAGIVWTYMKDMSHLMAMWKAPQKVIFDLPNQTNVNLTGTYITTLTATFFTAKQPVNPASVVLPLSAMKGVNASQPSAFTISSDNASTVLPAGSIPRNANRAIVTLAATGQGDEEFWWQNTLTSAVSTYNASGGLLFGNSPFREVQLMVDGQMAGVVWPYPVIFTGGIVPAFWSPMVGTQTFDLQEAEVDVSPWLGILCDGNAHAFDIRVVGLSDDSGKTAGLSQGVGSNWVVSGKVFIWTDTDSVAITTGDRPSIQASPPTISVSQSVSQNSTGANDTLIYSTSVHRTLTITSNIKTQDFANGRTMVWTQTLDQKTDNSFTSQGNIQSNTHATTGKDSFLLGVETPYTNSYSYPLTVNSTGTTLANGTTRFDAQLSRSRAVEISGQGVAPSGLQPFAELAESSTLVKTLTGTTMVSTENGTATLILVAGSGNIAGNGSASFGALEGSVRMGGRSGLGVIGMEPDEELWFRGVGVVNGSVREGVERVNGRGVVGGFEVDVDVDAVNGTASGDAGDESGAVVDLGMGRFLGRMGLGLRI